jgi:uncharacterized membrane protein YidH (DUF202 family)
MPGTSQQLASAAQRTDLAWTRSGLAVGLVVAVVLRRVAAGARTPVFVLVLVGAGLATWSAGFWIAHRIAGRRQEGTPAGARRLRLVTTGSVLIACASFVAGILAPP